MINSTLKNIPLYIATIVIVLGVLFLSCIALNIVVCYETRKHLSATKTLKLASSGTNVTRMSIHVSRRKASQLELEAAQSLMISVIILCMMPCIGVIFASIFFGCRFQYGQFECNDFAWVETYIEDISMIPAILSPFVALMRKKYLRSMFRSPVIQV